MNPAGPHTPTRKGGRRARPREDSAELLQLLEQVRAGREQLQLLSRRLLEAQETERRRIARELHDEIGQALSTLKMNLLTLQTLAGENELAAGLEESAGLVEHVLQRVRSLSLDLRPSLLDDLGLEAALRWLLDRQAASGGFEGRLVIVGLDRRLAPETETVCYRIAQEALTNIVRHAEAKQVLVQVCAQAGELSLIVRDDGIGFDVQAAQRSAASGGSLGLLGMQERALLAGGQLEIDSVRGGGTEVRARLPMRRPRGGVPKVERRARRRRA